MSHPTFRGVISFLAFVMVTLAFTSSAREQLGAAGQSATAQGPKVTVTGLFDPASPVIDFGPNNGGIGYLYFQAQKNLRLSQILLFGEPINIGPGDYFFVTGFSET